MVARHLKQPHRYVCVTDDPGIVDCETYPIWKDHNELKNHLGQDFPSCYRRLKIFDPETTRAMGIADGERVVSLDLDVVIVSALDPLFDRPEDFVGWRVPGGRNPSVFNGTLFMHRATTMSRLWNDFSPKDSPRLAMSSGYFGTDQGWLSYRLAQSAAGWTRDDGVLGYNQDCRLTGAVPAHARIISFHGGARKPWDARVRVESPWIIDHWR
jgi:hypothetical protein